jgi:hypothetical protein
MGIDDEMKHFKFVVEDAKRYFGQWDIADPVVWAILRVVEAQNDLAQAIDGRVIGSLDESLLEAAIAERRNAIAALQGDRTRAARLPMKRARTMSILTVKPGADVRRSTRPLSTDQPVGRGWPPSVDPTDHTHGLVSVV